MNITEESNNLPPNEVKVNILEVASNLAHDMTKDEMFREELITHEDDMTIGKDVLTYTEEAQDIFNRWYDYFYDEINKIKL